MSDDEPSSTPAAEAFDAPGELARAPELLAGIGARIGAARLGNGEELSVLRRDAARLAPTRERLEYHARVHNTAALALTDKQNLGFMAGGLLGMRWLLTGFTAAVAAVDPTVAVLQSLLESPARPRELRQRLAALGHSLSDIKVSKLLRRLRERGAIVAARLPGDRRGVVYELLSPFPSADDRPSNRQLDGAREILRDLPSSTRREMNGIGLVSVLGDLGRALFDDDEADLVDFVRQIDAKLVDWELATAEYALSAGLDIHELLGGMLWAAADGVDAFLRRTVAQRERQFERRSRSELRIEIRTQLALVAVANPSAILRAVAGDGGSASPSQVAKAIGDLLGDGVVEPAEPPPGSDSRERYYRLAKTEGSLAGAPGDSDDSTR